jgi:hypothetical protein
MFEAYLNQGIEVPDTPAETPGSDNQQARELFNTMQDVLDGPTGRSTRYTKRPTTTAMQEEDLKNDEPEVEPWPAAKKVVIDWRMPVDNWRVMLFDKLEYIIEAANGDDEDEEKKAKATPGGSQ